jgi:Baseplate J-like protein
VIYACCTPLRRSVVRGNPDWNGIDYLEVVDHPTQRTLEVHFVNPLRRVRLDAANFRIEGGERIQNIKVVEEGTGRRPQDDVFTVKVDQPGDFSLYTLRIVTSASDDTVPPDIDPRLSAVEFSFKVECPSPFDCAPQQICPPTPQVTADIDYLAKDYASFCRLMLDRMAVLMPQWKARNAADIGVMLVEALAYTADQLSYQQDAVATEAYLRTARRRISLRRHARLMDYFISEGCNARTWVHFEVSADVPGSGGPAIPAGTKIATQIANQQTVIADDARVYNQAEIIFETMEPVQSLYAAHNEIEFYTWSDDRCCLPKGATRATLAGHHPNLKPGMVLIIEEVLGAQTGDPADADPTRRHAARLKSVTPPAPNDPPLTDPVMKDKITEIVWNDEDALPFPVCLWQYEVSEGGNQDDGSKKKTRLASVARGNIVLADHGLTYRDEALGSVPEPFLFTPPVSGGDNCAPSQPQPILPRFRPRLANMPLTHAGPAFDQDASARAAMHWSLRDVQPVVTLTDSNGTAWMARRDLLNSGGDSDEFVAEIDNDGAAVIRFGDDAHGRRPEPGTEFFASYRVGNGLSGNVGADSLLHIALNIPEIKAVRNPLPAQGGQEPESLEDVRQRAPVAYRVQERAVTPADYAEVTERYPDVQRAAATFRWTGSWHTVFLTVDRSGGAQVSPEFEDDIHNHVERYRMAGHDLEVDEPRFVALEIDMHVCVAADHFRSDVERALFDVFSNHDLPDGRRGLFHPDNFTFGQPVYLSAIYAAAHQVAGVESVDVRTFQRLGVPDDTALKTGRLDIDRLEIARLDNNRNFAERGQLTISLGGGK